MSFKRISEERGGSLLAAILNMGRLGNKTNPELDQEHESFNSIPDAERYVYRSVVLKDREVCREEYGHNTTNTSGGGDDGDGNASSMGVAVSNENNDAHGDDAEGELVLRFAKTVYQHHIMMSIDLRARLQRISDNR